MGFFFRSLFTPLRVIARHWRLLVALLVVLSGAAFAVLTFFPRKLRLLARLPEDARELAATASAAVLGVLVVFGVLLPLAVGLVRRYWAPIKRYWRVIVRVWAAAFGVLFGLLWWRASKLPLSHGAAFRLRDEVIRFGAATSGAVFVVLLLLGVLLPLALDRLEGRTVSSFIAARHVRASKSGFLTVISVLSICGVAVSSCALCAVTSVMGGFSQDLKRKILGNNAHITIDSSAINGFSEWEDVLSRVRLATNVAAATPVVRGEVMASSSSNTAGAIVRGIDTGSIGTVIDLIKNIEVGKLEYIERPELLTRLSPDEVIGLGPGGEAYLKGPDFTNAQPPERDLGTARKKQSRPDLDPVVRSALAGPPTVPGLILGRELARTLHLYVGDDLTLVSPLGDLGPMGVMPRLRKFRVAAIFYSGMYEYDASHVYMTLDAAEDYFSMGRRISAIEVKVTDAERASEIRPDVEHAVMRPELRVRDWRELNKNLFSALKLEKYATFIILSIAILVASFCIICTLLLMVTEKGKEIAILKAVGASDGSVLRIFMLEGVIIGCIGTALGVVWALTLCLGLSWFGVRLDPDVYYIDRLPIAVNASDYVAVTIASLLICSISTLYPAWAASKLRPVDGLRYE
jgi:lipoprotein-releasing system permease protein